MKFAKRFLRVSAAALALGACGRSDAQIARYIAGGSACRFEPRARSDAKFVIGLAFDKQQVSRIANAFIDRLDAFMGELPADAMGANRGLANEAKGKVTAFLDDPFKNADADFREFADEVGLRDIKFNWAVVSIGDIEFEFNNGKPEPKTMPEMAMAVAAGINMERLVGFLKRKVGEGPSPEAAVKEMQIAGEKAWRIVPLTENAVKKTSEMNLDPCFTSLDGQLALFATSRSVLEKQILLYRRGLGKGRLIRDFKPANGDIAYLAVKDFGAFVRQCMPDPEQQLKPLCAAVLDGDKMVLGLGDAAFRLSSKYDGNISFSAKVLAASEEDAEKLRSVAKMCVMVFSAQLGMNPDMPKQLSRSIQSWKIGGTGDEFEASHDDVLTMAAGIAGFTLQNATKDRGATRKRPVRRYRDKQPR